MAKTKEQKSQVIEKIKQNLDKQKSIFFIDFQKLKARDFFDLRKQLKEINALLYVAKKNLIEIAFQNKKIPIDIKKFAGQVGMIFSLENEILPAKIIHNFQEKYKNPEILGGFYEKEFIGAERVIELAKLPSKQELLAKLVNCLNAPIYNLTESLGASIKGLIYILSSKTQK